MCVLIVEDDPDLSAVLQETFLAAGRDVQLCGDGEDALSRAQDPTLDAIVLDVMLPVYSGFEVCQELRQRNLRAVRSQMAIVNQEPVLFDMTIGSVIGFLSF